MWCCVLPPLWSSLWCGSTVVTLTPVFINWLYVIDASLLAMSLGFRFCASRKGGTGGGGWVSTLGPAFINKWSTKSLRWRQLVSGHYTGFVHVLPTSLSLEKHGLCLYYVHSGSEEKRKHWWEVYWQQVRLIWLWDGQHYQTTGSSNNRHMSSGYWREPNEGSYSDECCFKVFHKAISL